MSSRSFFKFQCQVEIPYRKCRCDKKLFPLFFQGRHVAETYTATLLKPQKTVSNLSNPQPFEISGSCNTKPAHSSRPYEEARGKRDEAKCEEEDADGARKQSRGSKQKHRNRKWCAKGRTGAYLVVLSFQSNASWTILEDLDGNRSTMRAASFGRGRGKATGKKASFGRRGIQR
jgi:hypothetical protein